jgi:hypothetical protein
MDENYIFTFGAGKTPFAASGFLSSEACPRSLLMFLGQRPISRVTGDEK